MFFMNRKGNNVRKNKNKGFTLIELLVAIALVALISTLSITTLSTISSTRMRKTASTLKSSVEVTRNYAKTHGGNTYVSLIKTNAGVRIIEVSTDERADDGTRKDKVISDTQIDDKTLTIYYKLTGDHDEYQLGTRDATTVVDNMLQFTFSGNNGSFMGPNYIDYVILTNGSKEYKLMLEHKSGMIYYDYEDAAQHIKNEPPTTTHTGIPLPKFVVNGVLTKNILDIAYTGKIVQPELAYDTRNSKMSGVFRAKEVGEYKIVFSLKDPYNTQWEDGTTSDYMLTWTIYE